MKTLTDKQRTAIVDFLASNYMEVIKSLYRHSLIEMAQGDFNFSSVATVFAMGYIQALEDAKKGIKQPKI